MNPVCHILVAGDKAVYDLFEEATRDWLCPLGVGDELGRVNVDWAPAVEGAASVYEQRIQHRVLVLADDEFGRGVKAVEDVRRRGLSVPVVMVARRDATREQLRRALALGATEIVSPEASHTRLTEALERAVVRSHATVPHGEPSPALLSIIGASGDGLMEWTPRDDTITCSAAFRVQAGLDPDQGEADLGDWLGRIHADDRSRVKRTLKAVADGILPSLEVHYRLQFGPGGYRWMLLRGRLIGAPGQSPVKAVQTDVTAGSVVMGEVAALDLSDRLTGLPTRAVLLARTAQCVQESRDDESYTFALVALDLDRFARINDSFGHVIGDELLKGVAKRLLKSVRSGDVVARTGSDDFAMLLADIAGVGDAEAVVAKVTEAMSKPFELAGHKVFCSFSAGIVMARSRYDKPEDLLRDASLALRRARTGGGDRSEVFETNMHMSAVNDQLTEILLKHGIAADQLRLHFQPLFAMQGERVLAGFEALVRWQHPTRGLLMPGHFIPIAEDSDLIVELGAWVLANACKQAAPWLSGRTTALGTPMVLNINVGARHFNHPSILQDVVHALEVSNIDPHHVQLEITESGLMDHVGIAIPNVRQLSEMGIGVQVDDFGTGYSSLSYLTQLEVSALKVDRSFTQMLPGSRPHMQIVEAIVSLARILNLAVTAEGIETPEQMEAVASLGCTLGQGHLLGEPIPADEVEAWLRSQGIL